MKTFLWVLASFFIEPAEVPVGAEACGGAASVRGLELELELARTRDLYFELDVACRELRIFASGVRLDSVPLASVEFMSYRRARGASDPMTPVELPAVLTVAEDVSAASRRIVAPPVLRPYPEKGDPVPALPLADPGDAAAAAPPPSYQVRLDEGRVLELRPRPVPRGFAARISQALGDGWARLRGEAPERPDRIVLVAGPEEARRLHHLFRAGTRILVL